MVKKVWCVEEKRGRGVGSYLGRSYQIRGTSNVLAMDARILALKSIPTKHAMPATKAAKTAAYLPKFQ